ncbi:MAG: 50S ribosomal protein L15 [Zetaproteobacteria bacterium]|nr:50S ribosomal protein L15 [Zetaproteobacteria bacterium]
MKNLGNLSPAPGSNKSRKRIGRGPGSGNGKTSGKGHKGQKARKGSSIVVGRKGMQRAMYKSLPKYGFTNARTMKVYHEINLDQLNVLAEGTVVSKETLVESGILRKVKHPIKILGRGELSKKLILKVEKCTKSVRAQIERLGGSIEEI